MSNIPHHTLTEYPEAGDRVLLPDGREATVRYGGARVGVVSIVIPGTGCLCDWFSAGDVVLVQRYDADGYEPPF